MYVAMNVFACEDEASAKVLEERFLKRSGLVDQQPGFINFMFLKCAENPRRHISLSTWRSKEDFEAWTKSQAFEKGHQQAKASGKPAPHGPMKMTNALETYEVLSHTKIG
ncbi:MAG: antibiotic biosynthesis monooxygenase [Planctomycetes bacterium]|nr:antibiotic biosynthesis monooxygenase [Planctomycetota bacterium]